MSIRSTNVFMDKSYSCANVRSLDENRLNSSLSNNKKVISNNINAIKNNNNDRNNNMNNKMNNNKNSKEDLRIQLKCCSLECKQQQNFLFSNNLSYMNKKISVHNHRKLKPQTIHEYDNSDMPKFNQEHKQSAFSIFFMSEHDKKFKFRYVLHEEQKQREEIKKYQEEKVKEEENNKLKNGKVLKGKRNYGKQQDRNRVMINCGDVNNNNIKCNDANNNSINNNNNKSTNAQIKTRQQQKQHLLGSYLLQLSRHPFPDHKNNYCFPCKSTYLHYNLHIQQQNHKHNIRQCLGEQFLLQQLQSMDLDKKEALKMKEYEELEKLAGFLQKIVGEIQQKLIGIKNTKITNKRSKHE